MSYYLLTYQIMGSSSLSCKIVCFGLNESIFITQCTVYVGGTKIAITEIESLYYSLLFGLGKNT